MITKRKNSTIIILALVFSIISVAEGLENADLEAIQAAIQQKGAKWVAGETSVSGLSAEKKRLLAGGLKEEVSVAPNDFVLLPSYFDWRDEDGQDLTTPVKRQLCSDCWAFASAAAFESLIKINRNSFDESIEISPQVDLSEQFVVSCSKGECTAWSLSAVLNFLRDTGTVTEACFPYVSGVPPCNERCPDWADKIVKLGDWQWISNDVNTIKQEILKTPVVTWMQLYSDFYSYKGGIYSHVSGDAIGGHFVVIVGWDDDNECWICKNSWGEGWGEDGWFRIVMGANESGIEGGTAAIGFADTPVATVLEKFSGDNQSDVMGAKLLKPLVVLVKDQYDRPMPDVQVHFGVTQGDGGINLRSAFTDASGKASVELTLGQTPGLNEVTATLDGLSVKFTAYGREEPRIIYVDDDNSTGIEDGSPEHPFNTIQEGIDSAFRDDTVIVVDGTYKGVGNKNLDFKGKAITVESENGAEYCIIDCEDNGRGFDFHSGEGENSVVSGFTIQHGYVYKESGGGIHCISSSPTIARNIIRDCHIYGHGTGIACQYGASPTITDNIITKNKAEPSVGYTGGGIYCDGSSSPVIMGNTVTGNSSAYGGGIRCIENSAPTITRNLIAWNSASRNGGGISCDHSSPVIANNTITRNLGWGGGIESWYSGPIVRNTILWNNSSPEILEVIGSVTVTYSDVQGGYSGVGNINADPLFVAPDSSDFHLQSSSPCIDAGDTNSPKDPDGTRADMGAFYYDQGVHPVPTTLEKVSGDNQSGNVGSVLPKPLIARVLDQNSKPMKGVTVNFLPSERALVNPTQAKTNEDGQAQTILTLGMKEGNYNVTASVKGLKPVVFTATAIVFKKPAIFSISPNYGYTAGGTEVIIMGINFQDGVSVAIGDGPAVDVTNPVEVPASIASAPIDITDEASGNVQLSITLGPVNKIILFSTSQLNIAVLELIIQTAADNIFGQSKINATVSGSDTAAAVTFTTVAIGGTVRLNIKQFAGSDILFSEPITSSGGERIHATTPDGSVGPEDVVVTNPDGHKAIFHNGFVYIPVTGDVSGDNNVTAYDAALILQFVIGIIDTFPVEGMFSPDTDTPRNYTVSVPNLKATVGSKIQASIVINGTTGLTAGGIILKYNPSILKPMQVASTLSGTYWKVNTNITGEIRFAFAAAEPISGKKNLLMVEFEALPETEGQASPLILDTVQLSGSKGGSHSKFLSKANIAKVNGMVTILPSKSLLLQNYPNPFNPETWIPYQLAVDSSVMISIYNAKGQVIRTIPLGTKRAGVYVTKGKAAYWDGKDRFGQMVASGIYLYTLRTGDFRATRKMVIVK